MKVGIALPSMVPGFDRAGMLAWMRGADAGPFSVLGVGERISYPAQEMMATLAAAAAVTERIGLEATVSVAPMHSAVHVAKQAATIDVISAGRFTLGVGVGGRDEDYRALEASFDHRHARLDEQVETMRRVWRGEPPLPGVAPVGPLPVRPGGPRVLTAAMGPRSMARSARWADGIAGFDLGADPLSIGATFRHFETAWHDAGRSGAPYLQTSFWFGLLPDAPGRVPAYAHRYLSIFGERAAEQMAGMVETTDATAVTERLRTIAEVGADEVILVATTTDPEELARAADLVGSL